MADIPTVVLKKVKLPFDKVPHWEMLLNGELFGRYQTVADAKEDAKHYVFRIVEIDSNGL